MIDKKSSPVLWAGEEKLYYDQIDSTNMEAVRQAKAGAKEGLLIIAKEQTMGKGRRGRIWSSKAEGDIYMSLLLRPSFPIERASMVTLVQALAVRSVLEVVCEKQVHIKWPNDILIDGKKVCGILTEMLPEEGKIAYLVIGTGVNVNRCEFSEELKEIASSLYLVTGKHLDQEMIIETINQSFRKYYEVFLETEDLSFLKDEYNLHLINLGREVRILDPVREFTGYALGITSYGELLVKKEDNEVVKIASGEVSIRGDMSCKKEEV